LSPAAINPSVLLVAIEFVVLLSVDEIVITPSASVVTVVAPDPLIDTESIPVPLPPAAKFNFTSPFADSVDAEKS
jgi:hypothetical protein